MQSFRRILSLALAVGVLSVGVLAAAPIIGPKADEGSDKWLVDDAESITVLNFKAAFKSPLLSKGLVADLFKKALDDEKVKQVLGALDMDPMKDLDSMIVSASNVTEKEKVKARVVLRGKFDVEKVTAALKKADKVKSVEEGKVQMFEFEAQDQKLYGAFHGKEAFIITESKEATAALAKDGPAKAAKLNKEMTRALKRFTGKETVAMAILFTEEMKKTIPPPAAAEVKALNSITLAVTLTKDVDVALVGSTDDGKAKKMAEKLIGLKAIGEGLLGDMIPKEAKDLLEEIKIDNTRDTVTISLKVPQDAIEKAIKKGG